MLTFSFGLLILWFWHYVLEYFFIKSYEIGIIWKYSKNNLISQIYVTGGSKYSMISSTKESWCYNPDTNNWKKKPDLISGELYV